MGLLGWVKTGSSKPLMKCPCSIIKMAKARKASMKYRRGGFPIDDFLLQRKRIAMGLPNGREFVLFFSVLASVRNLARVTNACQGLSYGVNPTYRSGMKVPLKGRKEQAIAAGSSSPESFQTLNSQYFPGGYVASFGWGYIPRLQWHSPNRGKHHERVFRPRPRH